MAQFDVLKTKSDGLVLDCQSDVLAYLRTRFVVPLLPPELEPKVAERLNPVFIIDDKSYVLYPQFAASMSLQELGPTVGSLLDEHIEIMDALDMLIIGY